MPDMVNHPPHYTECLSHGYEVINFTRHMDFLRGNAFKYVARHKHKGNPVQDLEKALFYLKEAYGDVDYMSPPLKHGEIETPYGPQDLTVALCFAFREMDPRTMDVLLSITLEHPRLLDSAIDMVEKMIQEEKGER